MKSRKNKKLRVVAGLCAGTSFSSFVNGIKMDEQQQTAAIVNPKKKGKYVIDVQIDKGGFGLVYRVHRERHPHIQYAMKQWRVVVNDEAEDEANTLKNLKHDHIVAYVDLFMHENVYYLVMELADGGSLSSIIKNVQAATSRGSWNAHRIHNWFSQIVSGVSYLHDKHVLHRDLKPSNVLLIKNMDGPATIKICDFGLAKMLECTLGEASKRAGTSQYMSPLQLNQKPYSFPADVWALGCVLFEMVMRTRAFNFPMDTLVGDIPQIPDDAPGGIDGTEFQDLCGRMLDREPENRPNARELLQELSDWSSDTLAPTPGSGKHVSNNDEDTSLWNDSMILSELDSNPVHDSKHHKLNRKGNPKTKHLRPFSDSEDTEMVLKREQTRAESSGPENGPPRSTKFFSREQTMAEISSGPKNDPRRPLFKINENSTTTNSTTENTNSYTNNSYTDSSMSFVYSEIDNLPIPAHFTSWSLFLFTVLVAFISIALNDLNAATVDSLLEDLKVVRLEDVVGITIAQEIRILLKDVDPQEVLHFAEDVHNSTQEVLVVMDEWRNATRESCYEYLDVLCPDVTNPNTLAYDISEVVGFVVAEQVEFTVDLITEISDETNATFTSIFYPNVCTNLTVMYQDPCLHVTVENTCQVFPCDVISGNLRIAEKFQGELRGDIQFPNLEAVRGGVYAYMSHGTSSIYLPNLNTINGSLYVNNNQNLVKFDFPDLTTIGKYVRINHNPFLKSFNLPALSNIRDYLLLYDNDVVTDLYLPTLQKIHGKVRTRGQEIYVGSNEKLRTIWFPELTFGANFSCDVNEDESQNCISQISTGRCKLQNADNDAACHVTDNAILSLMKDALDYVWTYEYAFEAELLDTMTGVTSSEVYDYLVPKGVQLLGSFISEQATYTVTYITSPHVCTDFRIMPDKHCGRNVIVTDTCQVFNCETISGDLRIAEKLKGELRGDIQFPHVTEVRGGFYIYMAHGTSKVFFPKLNTVKGALYVNNNQNLKMFNFPDLMSVGKFVRINQNPFLTGFDLPSLSDIRGYFLMYDNDAVANLNLPALRKIRGEILDNGLHIYIGNNDKLTSISIPEWLFDSNSRCHVDENEYQNRISRTYMPQGFSRVWSGMAEVYEVIEDLHESTDDSGEVVDDYDYLVEAGFVVMYIIPSVIVSLKMFEFSIFEAVITELLSTNYIMLFRIATLSVVLSGVAVNAVVSGTNTESAVKVRAEANKLSPTKIASGAGAVVGAMVAAEAAARSMDSLETASAKSSGGSGKCNVLTTDGICKGSTVTVPGPSGSGGTKTFECNWFPPGSEAGGATGGCFQSGVAWLQIIPPAAHCVFLWQTVLQSFREIDCPLGNTPGCVPETDPKGPQGLYCTSEHHIQSKNWQRQVDSNSDAPPQKEIM
eukprot:gene473-380_t